MQSNNLLGVGLLFTVGAWIGFLALVLEVITGSGTPGAPLRALGFLAVAVVGTLSYRRYFRRPAYGRWDDYMAALRSWEQEN